MSFLKEEIEYLGHVVSGKGISTNPKKVEAVAKWPTPQTVYDVRSFLGFVGYYRRFIKNFSKIAKPYQRSDYWIGESVQEICQENLC